MSKLSEHQRIDTFELWCWRRLLRVPWTVRRSNQSILKEISPELSLEGLMLKLKLQYFGHLIRRTDSLEKTDAGKDWTQEEKGMTENEMVGWHHWLNGHEFEQVLGVDDGQVSLACCSPLGCKESDRTEELNWLNWITYQKLHQHFHPGIYPQTSCKTMQFIKKKIQKGACYLFIFCEANSVIPWDVYNLT